MSEFDTYKSLCKLIEILQSIDVTIVDRVADIRYLIKNIDIAKNKLLDNINVPQEDIANFQFAVENAVLGNSINIPNVVETTSEIKMFQKGSSTDNVVLDFVPNSLIPPERGTIIQKLWKVSFKDNTFGYAIISDITDTDLAELFNSQISTALGTSPKGAVEDLNKTILLEDFEEIITVGGSRDLSEIFTDLEKPGLTARQLRDIDIDTDPALESLTVETKTNLKNAINILNSEDAGGDIESAKTLLKLLATDAGLYSTALGPMSNLNYSDLKRFRVQKGGVITTVTLSMPIISWGSPIPGIPLRDNTGAKNKENRKDDGTSYIVDLGGIDPVIRVGPPNPLPATRYVNNGPLGSTVTEGALDRYKGGKCVGINTTNTEVQFESVLKEKDGIVTITVPPLSAIWKIDRATFDLGNSHAYYTVFSASRSPAAGYMGVVLAPKQNRLGRGRGEIASGVTLANGISSTGKTFNKQDSSGTILHNGVEIPSGLKGVTCSFDGHGMDPVDFLKFLEENSFTKGSQYLTIPANATIDTVEDILIPAGEFIPQITQGVGTLIQFGNGKYIQDGGPNRFQAGLIPFLPGTPAYTPEWHINWITYNCGEVECDDVRYPIENPALDTSGGSWAKPNHNVSYGQPGPNPNNSKDSGFSPEFPDTFDPVQLRCGIKGITCLNYINKLNGAIDREISLSMLTELERDNKILVTEAPVGALRGWVKFLVVNCPLPVVATINVVGETPQVPSSTNTSSGSCVTCSCDRVATTVSINGDFNPIWLEEDSNGIDNTINNRILKLKVGDNLVIRSTTGTVHGVALRLDDVVSNVTFDNSKTLETIQNEVLTEIKTKITINNEEDLENNITALSDDIITFHGGIPITFSQKATVNPINFPDGVAIADITIKESASGSSGSVACTVHGSNMSFKFTVCP